MLGKWAGMQRQYCASPLECANHKACATTEAVVAGIGKTVSPMQIQGANSFQGHFQQIHYL
ncbi:hypothetical protein RS694_17035 [Rhodoferax saidenbachensis]|uniref:Uncharacterized protein n=1 Tax=Rhodoferax saidenbachensis TaxID=1484693 RepID=A0A1P8KDF1_9BURK|nr:hypothetical protein RS694_17035 [Rhodoferax saidenbachensis]